MFAPVLLEVPGQMTRCPCGFGAYGAVPLINFKDRTAIWYITQTNILFLLLFEILVMYEWRHAT